ncbi:MAG: diguanylate cyclase [Deinococcus sp.]|uniref:GGDEF domain-containing protein n=1 Tax=Deinococcus sp. TaxID=47478 RepID=UPI0026DB397C|nr:diguanylate cyclase [Deinococcus sp.]MDO4246720.1 diguanylate cyclase [Deinococcus sp.]
MPSPAGPPLSRAARLLAAARWLCGRSLERSYIWVQEAARVVESSGETDLLAQALNFQATIEIDLGLSQLAHQKLLRVQQLAEDIGDAAMRVKAANNLGLLHVMRGEIRDAMRELQAGYQIVQQEAGAIPPTLTGRIIINVAAAYNLWNEPEKALHTLDRLSQFSILAPEMQVYSELTRAHANLLLAQHHRTLGQPGHTAEHLDMAEQSLRRSDHLQDPLSPWVVHCERELLWADWLVQQGRNAEAEQKLRDALTSTRSHYCYGEIKARLALARLLDDPAQAITLLREALDLSRKSGITEADGELLEVLAARYEALGEWRRALEIQKERVALLQRRNHLLTRENMEFVQEAHDAVLLKGDPLQGRLRKAEYEARTDSLTGLHNRRAIEEKLPGLIGRLTLTGHSLHVILADIDHFKGINDTYSHLFGDEVLRRIAQLFQQAGRRTFAARYGGEELLLAAEDLSDREAYNLAEQLRQQVMGLRWDDPPNTVTISLGLTRARPDDTAVSLLGRADQALYQAKEGGRNRTVVLEPEEFFAPEPQSPAQPRM